MDEAESKKALEAKRDELQKIMSEARKQRADLRLENIDKYVVFLQKLGELSLLFGAAIVPLIIVGHSDTNKVQHLDFVIIGVGLYLLNGLVSLWRSKHIFERNADDAPYVGLDEEIHTYPIINAHNKLLFELYNKDYQEEYRQASINFLEWAHNGTTLPKPRVSVLLDVLLINFVIASLLVVRAAWPYPVSIYWWSFGVISLFVVALTVISYIKSWQSQVILENKRKTLADIKAKYQEWHNKTILSNKK